ncbi:phosphonate metabolism transcriptional regulator PhnF [Jiella sp. MQZ9-1]|uniref:Phosphonate metabolism transcriptional regulator PhnF n=1 Tax=Jiella flava TaxID=2816857 RepID=A0A939G028_9HYPH|nr:phosphonate metabolism transcriptional regulator PhnF [Jiella flava]MBO0663133.1 phosphonate metabolism transcriptional regulator PhnF [Jiella flava]MCD2471552.1 phosphonate metabolism transcriptional regulator PhnF [Jiella flava]
MNLTETAEGVAKWLQVSNALRAALANGAFGAQLPPETELADRFAVNRHTVRRAIAALTAEGLLRAERGKGTFVAGDVGRMTYRIGAKTRFSENVAAAAHNPGGRLIGTGREAATIAIAEKLGCRPGTQLLRLETLGAADETPVLIATSWLVAERFNGMVTAYAETGSITAALARLGVADYRRVETRVTAQTAGPSEALRLGCAVGTPLLQTVGIDADTDLHPIQVVRTRFLADRFELFFAS